MTARDKLISVSNLSGCHPALDHFCSIFGGGNKIVSGLYTGRYIESPRSKIKYVKPDTIKAKYIPANKIKAIYVPSEKQIIKYKPSPTIKGQLKCKP